MVSDEIKERTYDLKPKGQGRMIQVSIPASVPLKEFDYNAPVAGKIVALIQSKRKGDNQA
ncbi:DUF961 family protein [Virgibacillus proomii]|uniref:DUF961 family protein n=1 Tax=Virgibacillus proomii TaxID=84407 RepID=UPI003CCC2026